jgi:hypothetical protein
MVHNSTRIVKFPFSNGVMVSHTKKMSGSGTGSVLLRTGGPGAGSSYMDIDDYIRTTGINPYSRASSSEGSGMKGVASKLARLKIESPNVGKPKMKNITMSI